MDQDPVSQPKRSVSIAAVVFSLLAVGLLIAFQLLAHQERKIAQKAQQKSYDMTWRERAREHSTNSELEKLLTDLESASADLARANINLHLGISRNLVKFSWASFVLTLAYAGVLQVQKRRKEGGANTVLLTIMISIALPVFLVIALLIIRR